LSLDLLHIHFNSIAGVARLFREQELSDDTLQTAVIEENKRKWQGGCLKMLSCHLLGFLGNDKEERSQFTT